MRMSSAKPFGQYADLFRFVVIVPVEDGFALPAFDRDVAFPSFSGHGISKDVCATGGPLSPGS